MYMKFKQKSFKCGIGVGGRSEIYIHTNLIYFAYLRSAGPVLSCLIALIGIYRKLNLLCS